MTTLELAEECALAAIEAFDRIDGDYRGDTPAQAVLRALHDNQAWFCRLSLDEEDGIHTETHEVPFPYQPELFELIEANYTKGTP